MWRVWFLGLNCEVCDAAPSVGDWPSGVPDATEHGPSGPRAVSWFRPDGPMSYRASRVHAAGALIS